MVTDERTRIAVSLRELGRMILRLLPVIICWSAFCCTLLYCVLGGRGDPVFTAETSIYVLSRSPDSDYGRLDVSDLDVSQQMTMDAMSILSNEQMAAEVLANLKGDAAPLQTMSASNLLNMVNIYRKDDSLEISIAVSGTDPYVVCDVANTYRETAIRELSDRIMARGIQTVKEAVIPLSPSGRSAGFYGAVGLLLGLMSACGMIVIVYIVRHAERYAEDVRRI